MAEKKRVVILQVFVFNKVLDGVGRRDFLTIIVVDLFFSLHFRIIFAQFYCLLFGDFRVIPDKELRRGAQWRSRRERSPINRIAQ